MDNEIDLYGDFNESDDAAAVGDDDENVPNDGDQDEAVKKVELNPKARRSVRVVRCMLNEARLTNLEKGVSTLEKHYLNIKFQGKGFVKKYKTLIFYLTIKFFRREKEDLDNVLKRMEHWANRLYPRFNLDDCLTKIDQLGKKKLVQRHMSQYRINMLEPVVSLEEPTSDKENNNQDDEPIDEYEDLINQQIALSTVNNTNTSRANTSFNSNAAFDELSASSKPINNPPPTPTPVVVPAIEQIRLTDELRARIAENKRLAMEKLKARQLAREQENLGPRTIENEIPSQSIVVEATQEAINSQPYIESQGNEADSSILSGILPIGSEAEENDDMDE